MKKRLYATLIFLLFSASPVSILHAANNSLVPSSTGFYKLGSRLIPGDFASMSPSDIEALVGSRFEQEIPDVILPDARQKPTKLKSQNRRWKKIEQETELKDEQENQKLKQIEQEEEQRQAKELQQLWQLKNLSSRFPAHLSSDPTRYLTRFLSNDAPRQSFPPSSCDTQTQHIKVDSDSEKSERDSWFAIEKDLKKLAKEKARELKEVKKGYAVTVQKIANAKKENIEKLMDISRQLTTATQAYKSNNSPENRLVISELKNQLLGMENTFVDIKSRDTLIAKADRALGIPLPLNENEQPQKIPQHSVPQHIKAVQRIQKLYPDGNETEEAKRVYFVSAELAAATKAYAANKSRKNRNKVIAATVKIANAEQKSTAEQKLIAAPTFPEESSDIQDQDPELQERLKNESNKLFDSVINLKADPKNRSYILTLKKLYKKNGYRLFGTDKVAENDLKEFVEKHALDKSQRAPDRPPAKLTVSPESKPSQEDPFAEAKKKQKEEKEKQATIFSTQLASALRNYKRTRSPGDGHKLRCLIGQITTKKPLIGTENEQLQIELDTIIKEFTQGPGKKSGGSISSTIGTGTTNLKTPKKSKNPAGKKGGGRQGASKPTPMQQALIAAGKKLRLTSKLTPVEKLPAPTRLHPDDEALFRGLPTSDDLQQPPQLPESVEEEAKVSAVVDKPERKLVGILNGGNEIFVDRDHFDWHFKHGDDRRINRDPNYCYKDPETGKNMFPCEWTEKDFFERLKIGIANAMVYTDEKGDLVIVGKLGKLLGDTGPDALEDFPFKAIIKKEEPGIIKTCYPLKIKALKKELKRALVSGCI